MHARLDIFVKEQNEKWKSFGWSVVEVDGHNHNELKESFSNIPKHKRTPTVFIANTIKGKGVSFMENSVLWHYRCPKGEEFKSALKELET